MSAADITTLWRVARWEPDARGRLGQAALDLYSERGFERTTVAEIAKRAGLTERTFFRHFADKREVLFGGQSLLEKPFVEAVEGAPGSAAPIDAVAAGLDAAADALEDQRGREHAQKRQIVIAANRELQERELIKLASLAAAVTEALRARGVGEPAASLTAEAGIAVFRVAFDRWVDRANQRNLALLIRESLAELKAVTAATGQG